MLQKISFTVTFNLEFCCLLLFLLEHNGETEVRDSGELNRPGMGALLED